MGGFALSGGCLVLGGVLTHALAQDSLLTLIRKCPFCAAPSSLRGTISLWKYSAEVKGIYKSNQIDVWIKDTNWRYDVVAKASGVIINVQLLSNMWCPSDISFRFTWKIFVKINESPRHTLFLFCLIAREGKIFYDLLGMLFSIQRNYTSFYSSWTHLLTFQLSAADLKSNIAFLWDKMMVGNIEIPSILKGLYHAIWKSDFHWSVCGASLLGWKKKKKT